MRLEPDSSSPEVGKGPKLDPQVSRAEVASIIKALVDNPVSVKALRDGQAWLQANGFPFGREPVGRRPAGAVAGVG